MESLSGSISATLVDRDESYEKSLVDEINRAVHPPRPVKPEEVYIRAMYIVSDQVNSLGGRFADDELDRLSELLIDSPVMVGHRRDSLPVARNFMAVKLEVEGRTWIKSYFYWMKDSVGAEDLKKNIDGGIYKECSISFLYTTPECSICGEDVRRCPHTPFHEYDVGGSKEIAHFTYRDIVRVLETSLVFRGAVPDTRITDRLTSNKDAPENNDIVTATHNFTISDMSGSGFDARGYTASSLMFLPVQRFALGGLVASVHVFPHQPGLIVRIMRGGETVELETSMLLPEPVRARIADMARQARKESFVVDAVLYASRGKDRLNGSGLMQAIESEINLHRLRLKLCDVIEMDGQSCLTEPYENRRRRLKTLYGETPGSDVTIIHPRHYETKDLPGGFLAEMCRKYNFGAEVLCERADGALSRYVLTSQTLIPVRIDDVSSRGRSQVSAKVSRLGNDDESRTAIGKPMAGIEKEAMALVCEEQQKKSGRRPIWRLFDVIPGGESLRIQTPNRNENREPDRLEIRRVGASLNLVFPTPDRLMEATVHHFSTELFARRRKFIADVHESDLYGKDRPLFQVLPVKHISRTGKLIRISLSTLSKLFGDAAVLWFRPVLIDGEERHLFYADGVSDRPEEV